MFYLRKVSGNITAAANRFYLTQSTVSKRLAALERELGAKLFERGKGRQSVSPTPEGQAFYDLAERSLTLYAQALRLSDQAPRRLITLACMNSAQSYTLPPFIGAYQRQNPALQFSLEDHHSVEIFPLVLGRRVDAGVTQAASPYAQLQSVLLYEESYVVVTNAAARSGAAAIHPRDLDPEREVYQAFCDPLRLWHDGWFPRTGAKLRVNTTATAMRYLTEPEDWMIVPKCIADDIEGQGFVSHALLGDPPPHRAYAVWRGDLEDAHVHRFVKALREYFRGQ